MEYSERTYQELQREKDKLEIKYNDIMEESLKDSLPYTEFCEKAHDIKERLYFIDKYSRLKKDPTMEFGKTWKGETMTIEQFKKYCQDGYFADFDGIGYYATIDGKSDIQILPSDILENIYRTDFTHVIWANK